jgi:hypothetical protein
MAGERSKTAKNSDSLLLDLIWEFPAIYISVSKLRGTKKKRSFPNAGEVKVGCLYRGAHQPSDLRRGFLRPPLALAHGQ